SASRSVGGEEYYNTDVKFNLTFKDTYSGLRKWSYTGGKTLSDSMDYAQAAGDDLTQIPAEAITYEYSQDLTLSASSNNENDIKVTAEFTDNAGHTGSVEQMYHIDVTAPVVTVEYDLNAPSNEKFYNQTRTATVTIKERNFDESDVEFTITNTDGQMPSISGWSSSGSGDDTSNVCHVTFSADGDYTFTVAFQDKAGNAAEYSQVDEFTIDQTKPTVTVSYDHNQSTNEFYYAQSRTATIDVLEHNFDPSLMEVLVTADGVNVSMLSGWSKNGDHNVASVSFSADADYTFDLSGKDQAENPLDEYEIESFVVDQTPPELEIFDIEDMSANNGEVRPGIRYSDTNYDANGTEILMKGYHNGTLEMNARTLHTANGVEVKLDDFERIPENDDLYTMEATVYDMAGNSSDASVTFSVNRFGSVYTFDEETDDLVGDQGIYYVNKERELVVYETNVDTLEFKEITCNLNGSLTTLEEGTDYTVDMSGTDVSWKQYTYRIPKRNFAEEGTYILTIYSEDRAANTSDNHTKGKKIEFAVDKTNPSILIAGVEHEGQYRENEREITLDIQDNIRLSEVEVRLNDQVSVYSSAEVSELDGKITLTAQSANYWQTLQVKAYDAAGNEHSSEELIFLVTSNILVQFFMNKPLFYGTVTGLASVTAGMGWFFRRRRRKLM
ncbi:MAG: Ig-like domain repeat protein, partial [Lachnospiraceae bacterium]|nr:Ig-like domain repeat protein [Lachnospiraceae bacterium]